MRCPRLLCAMLSALVIRPEHNSDYPATPPASEVLARIGNRSDSRSTRWRAVRRIVVVTSSFTGQPSMVNQILRSMAMI
jgi:hypothetical protein